MGPFQEERNGWNLTSLYIPKYNAKITAASTEQSVRSYRHMQYRPQLIVCDDLEDMETVKTIEGRDKTHVWLLGDVIPSGSKATRIFVVGSLLHNDCLIRRLQKEIQDHKRDGVYREFPFLDAEGKPMWPSKFPDEESVNMEKQRVGNEIAWQREYMLKIITEEEQIVKPEWLKYYDIFPEGSDLPYRYTIIGVDPAISEKPNSNFTAITAISVYGHKQNLRLFVHPNPINERLSFEAIKNKVKSLSQSLGRGSLAQIVVENIAAQDYLVQELKSINLPARGFNAQREKRERLIASAALIEQGKVFFPKDGVEILIEQLLGFGNEKYDDLADSLSMLLIEINTKELTGCFSFFREGDDRVHYFGSGADDSCQTTPKDPKSVAPLEKGIKTVNLDVSPPWKNKEELKKLEKKLDLDIHKKQIDDAGWSASSGERLEPGPFWFTG